MQTSYYQEEEKQKISETFVSKYYLSDETHDSITKQEFSSTIPESLERIPEIYISEFVIL